jgi:hypothetical protein
MTAHEAYLLSSEDPAEFEDLLRSLEQTHQPSNAHERILVEEFASAYWEFRRARRIDREFWEYVGGHYNPGEAGIAQALAQEKESRFRIHLRLRAQAERSYYRALDALERMLRNRDRVSNKAARSARTPREIAVTAPDGLPMDAARLLLVTSEPAAALPIGDATETKPLASHAIRGATTHGEQRHGVDQGRSG